MPVSPRAKTLALISGAGGTGRTTVGVGLARYLAGLEQRVLLFDLCFGWGGLGLGGQEAISYSALLDADDRIEDAVVSAEPGFDVLTCLPPPVLDPSLDDLKKLVWLTGSLSEKYDFLILDPPSGGHPLSLLAAGSSDRIMLFTRPDSISVASSCRLLKSLNDEGIASNVGAVTSFVDSVEQAASVKARLDILAGQIPVARIQNCGFIRRVNPGRDFEVDSIQHLDLAAIAMLQSETAAEAMEPAFRVSAKVGR
ncbi:MAG: hypothetical protein A2W25_12960 [candidate division Zixibacteria bacterium RBG_16_53_22]|nr:MAG: hypothetical protein A2W25_12960 [candidate division Zixibacteria bacterium RBG_16_53_22]